MRILQRRPLVSVVLASCNHQSFITGAVNSVLEQGVEGLELIVVDDGSSDATPDIVEAIGDPRIRLVRLKDNRRLSPRNVALEMAKGEFVAFQNSDDLWRPGKLAGQLEYMEKNPDCSVCFTDVEVIGADDEPLSGSFASGVFTTENRAGTAWLRHFFDAGNCLCLTSAVCRRSQVEQVGRFRASLFLLGDLDLWVRLAARGRFHIIQKPLTCFRVVDGVNLSAPTPAAIRQVTVEYADVLERYTERPVLPLLDDAFGDVIPGTARSTSAKLAALAIHAWSLGPSHRLFADRVMAGILENPLEREEAIAVHGPRIVLDFIEKRSRLEIGIAE
jgi:glycosyltransferase involved in cell wall biosynthesis